VKGDLVVSINTATQTIEWTDQVFAGEDGEFSYTYPVPLSDPPRLILTASVGTMDPIVEEAGDSVVTGVLRFPNSGTMVSDANSNAFNIMGVGRLLQTNGRLITVPPTATGTDPDALTPSPQQTFTTGAPASNFRITFTPSFTAPDDIDEELLSSLRMSWASTQPWQNRAPGAVPDYVINAYITTASGTAVGEGVKLGSWGNIPGFGADATGAFANTAYNQSQTFGLLGLQQNEEYFINFDFNVEPELTENIKYALNFELLSYYVVVAPPPTVSAFSARSAKKPVKEVKKSLKPVKQFRVETKLSPL
jgi:hypothetical protein